jgi:polyisoprenoid-binding protein YceI
MKKISLISVLSLLALNIIYAQTLNSEMSIVKFGIGNMNIRTVEGTITGMKGEIRFDTTDLAGSLFNVCVDPTTVATGIKMRDKHLRGENFFHVETYPEICFNSSFIQKTASGFTTLGKLTMHGVSREVEIPFTYSNKQFAGTLEVNRFEYEVGEGTSTFTAGEIINLEIIAVLE